MFAYICLISFARRNTPELSVITCDGLHEIPQALDQQLPWSTYQRVEVYDEDRRIHVRGS